MDGRTTAEERMTLDRHLRECLVCRRRAGEMRSLRDDVQSLAAPQPASDLTGRIQLLLRREAARARETEVCAVSLSGVNAQLAGAGGATNWVEVRNGWFNWFDGLRARIFSQSIGAIVSLCLFFVVVTEVFEQAHRTLALFAAATQIILADPQDEAIRHQALLKAALLPSPPPPLLKPSDEFRGAVAGLQEEDVILTAEVRKDGRATIMYIVAPNDPSVKTKLSTAMSQRGIFQGAGPSRNTNPVAVVYLSSITISGSASI